MLSETRLNRRLHKIDYWNTLLIVFLKLITNILWTVSLFHPVGYLGYIELSYLEESVLKVIMHHIKPFLHGLKIHLIITKNGCPFLFQITPGSEHDLIALKCMDLKFPKPCRLYGGKAYNDGKFEEELGKKKIRLTLQRRANSLKSYTKGIALRFKKYRKRVEVAISGIVRLMPRWIQAVTDHGFEMKISLFILAYASNFLN